MEKEIFDYLERSKRPSTKILQKVELLARNKIFLKELKIVNRLINKEFHQLKTTSGEKDRILLLRPDLKTFSIDAKRFIDDKSKKIDKHLNKIESQFDPYYREEILRIKNLLESQLYSKHWLAELLLDIWSRFCAKWQINPMWTGDLIILERFLGPLIRIDVEDICSNPLPIVIRIGPWTRKKDLNAIWPEVEKIQKEKFYKLKKTSEFTRDICWYDLNKKFKKTPREIAALWIDKYPEDIDLLVIKRIKRLNKELEQENESDLLEEIKNDPSLKELKEQFEDEKKWYTTGQGTKGKFNPPFVDLIKKAIKNMEKRIALLNLHAEPIEIFIKAKIQNLKGKISTP